MKKLTLVCFVSFLLFGCDENSSTQTNRSQSIRPLCTQIGATTVLNIQLYKDSFLKNSLAYSINDEGITYDDCESEEPLNGSSSDKDFFYECHPAI
jgi:hypothetical protein